MPGKVVRDTDVARKESQRFRCSQNRQSEIQMHVARIEQRHRCSQDR